MANQRAIVADQAYVAQSGTEGLYKIGYVPHNIHFLWAAATLAGRSRTALDAADRLGNQVDTELLTVDGYDIILQDYWITPLLARVRFGKWDEVLAWPEMPEELVYPNGIRAYARAVAFARKGRVEEALDELAIVQTIAENPAMEEFLIWGVNPASMILKVASKVARASVQSASGDLVGAIRTLEKAARIEDRILYQEPESWHHPVRQILGQALLDCERYEDAERIFQEDLEKYPENGWSLFGLATVQERMGRTADAEATWARYREAFRDADVRPDRSVY